MAVAGIVFLESTQWLLITIQWTKTFYSSIFKDSWAVPRFHSRVLFHQSSPNAVYNPCRPVVLLFSLGWFPSLHPWNFALFLHPLCIPSPLPTVFHHWPSKACLFDENVSLGRELFAYCWFLKIDLSHLGTFVAFCMQFLDFFFHFHLPGITVDCMWLNS